LDGSLVGTWRTVGTPTDLHDFQLLDGGNALVGAYVPRPGTLDLTGIGGPAGGGTLVDGEIQEVAPDGELLWSWSTADHIATSEVPARWRPRVVEGADRLPDGREALDYAHWNSIQQVGDTVVVSFRHLDAVYGIDKTDGEILWKLGGTPTAASLTVLGDPESNPLGGQHYARVLPDGTLTIYDNNTYESAPPRAVRYRLDLVARTAVLLESVRDDEVSASPCCGSATRLGDGSWVMSWGGTPVTSEIGPTGARHFSLSFDASPGGSGHSYRVHPIAAEGPTIEDLRAGMDAMG
jgi:hypothetical protein